MKLKKRGKKKNFNKGTLILLVGLVFLVLTFISKFIFGSIEFIFYIKVFSFLLIYFGLATHFVLLGDKPFTKSWNFLRESNNYILFTFLLFLLLGFMGYFVEAPLQIQEIIEEIIRNLILETEGMNHFELVKFIFLNNLQVSFFGIIFGALFGILPMIYILSNGYLLGYVSKLAVNQEGTNVLFQLLPHGIFELPAVIISLSLGLKFGSFIFKKDKEKSFRKYLWSSLRIFLFIVVPLLAIAAIIEGSLM